MEKTKLTETTEKYKKRYYILTAASWILTLGPLAGYVIYALVIGGTLQKAALVSSVFAAGVLTVVSILFKKHIRSTVFILLLGIYMAIQKITVLLIIMSIATVLDEFVIMPLQKRSREKYTINKEIDGRINDG